MNRAYFVPTAWLPESQKITENWEYIPKIHQPERKIRIFLHRILSTWNISEWFVEMIAEAYEEQRKVNQYNSHTIRIPSVRFSLEELVSETSELWRDSKLSDEEKKQLRESIEQKMRETLWKIWAENSLVIRKSPHHLEIEELKINTTLIRRLQIAAGKQKLLEVLSWKVKYTYTPEQIIDWVRESLWKLWVTASYIDSFIEKKSPQTSASL